MANVANVKVLAGNQVQVSGSAVQLTGSDASLRVGSSQVVVTGSVLTNGDVSVGGTLTAANLVVNTVTTASTVFTSGSTRFGDEAGDSHIFTGSVNISGGLSVIGQLSASTLVGDGSGLTNLNLGSSAVTSLIAGQNIGVSSATGDVTVSLSSSISVTDVNASNVSASNSVKTNVLSASTAEISGNLLIYGSAILNSNLTNAAYVKYVAAPEDKIEIFPGLKVSGSTVVSGNLNVTGSVSASSFTGSGAALTNLSASNLSGIVSLANGGTGINASGVTSGQLLIGSGSTLQLGDLVPGSNIGITKGSGSITIAVTGNLGVSAVTSSDSNILIASSSGPSVTASLNSTLTGLSSITTDAIVSNTTVSINGGLFLKNTMVTGSYSVVDTDSVLLVNTTDPVIITLPNEVDDGRVLVVKKMLDSSNAVTLDGNAVDGESTFDLNGPYQSVTLISNGNDWFIV